jgi:roadblock/LC7 domain-containing protein
MAFEFTSDGKCTAHKNVSPEMAAMVARFCATVTMQFNTLAGAFTTLSDTRWVSQQGWMYAGGDRTVIIGDGGYRGILVETARANLANLLRALSVPS